ncbi:Xaa-Pro peptidase family protein [Sinorhizobium sp. 7-81]|uniref:M24 family metallopeptidase n=1 Tax=Sinorhizobium sp. 8-89 TaxID=3049089 RepID=UPI0024C385CD|nr:Xaa-Pro peptidase family protein [Sinorhizobium sp. 8-89]MDK1492931.1 Xaa-Pro peptidase family protein [Sinorhizobium sp. 8-89]
MDRANIPQAFEASEYRARLDKVRISMSKAGMDALVVISEANHYYLLGYDAISGFEPQVVLVTLNDDPYFILRKMDADTAADAGCWLAPDRVIGYAESYVGGSGQASAWEMIGRFVKDKVRASARIGVELSAISARGYAVLMGALGVRELRDGSDLVSACRIVKSERELLYMTEAAAIADRAMLAGIDKISVGTRHCEAAAAIMSTLCEGTEAVPGGPPPCPPFVRGGKFANAPHQLWIDDAFEAGQQYYLQFSASRHRYPAPITRVAHLGPATPRRKDRHEGALAGFHAALDALRPGATCSDVARAFQAAIRPYGLTKEERMGYSVGLDFSINGPSLGTNNDTEIVTNMTFDLQSNFIERGEIYLLSDTVRVTEDGAELMSTVPRILFERPA